MGDWLVGMTLHLLDQVVTHLVPLGDHWRGGKTGEFLTAQEKLSEVSWLWLYDWGVENMSLGMNWEWTWEFQGWLNCRTAGHHLDMG